MVMGIPWLELVVVLLFLGAFAFLTLSGYRLESRYWASKAAASSAVPPAPSSSANSSANIRKGGKNGQEVERRKRT